ncbi:calcium/sodium antiporter [Mariniphaga sp.]|uniref:calcium/sodium antiporter n=1 Tax=Mariniphaga sp. TaxID=1954475 RepID=UPI0035617E6A
MITQILLLILGFGILIKGADWLVNGGSALARKYKISELAIGLTIVAFGTSMPEFVVNAFAAYQSNADIVFGNIIGSNIFNLFAILGIAGLITPLFVQSSTVWKEIPFSLFATLLLFFLANSFISKNESLTRIDGIILLIFFLIFLYYVYRQLKNESILPEVSHKELSNLKIWIFIIAGLIFLVAGGRLVVVNSVQIAQSLGISQTIIGLTIVAAGTSLPELATSVVAATKKKNDIAIGNIIGSNIFNIYYILGVSALIKPVAFNTKFNFDLYLLGAGTILLFIAMFSGKKKKLDRWEAGVLLLIYVGYVIYLISKEIQ